MFGISNAWLSKMYPPPKSTVGLFAFPAQTPCLPTDSLERTGASKKYTSATVTREGVTASGGLCKQRQKICGEWGATGRTRLAAKERGAASWWEAGSSGGDVKEKTSEASE